MEKIIPNVKVEDPVAIWICFGGGHNSLEIPKEVFHPITYLIRSH